jgi:hypothetical protein
MPSAKQQNCKYVYNNSRFLWISCRRLVRDSEERVYYFFIASGVGLSPVYCGHFWPVVPNNRTIFSALSVQQLYNTSPLAAKESPGGFSSLEYKDENGACP